MAAAARRREHPAVAARGRPAPQDAGRPQKHRSSATYELGKLLTESPVFGKRSRMAGPRIRMPAITTIAMPPNRRGV